MPGSRFQRRPLYLLSALSNFRDLDATDPRDKIFAFLNLAEDELGLIPDYYADVRDVFRKAAEAMIRKTWTLSVLSHVQDPSETKIKDLPSWVPDFSARLGQTPFDQSGEDDRFWAGTDHELTPIFFNSDGTLTVDAIRVGNVSISTDLDGDTVIQPHHYPSCYEGFTIEGGGPVYEDKSKNTMAERVCCLYQGRSRPNLF